MYAVNPGARTPHSRQRNCRCEPVPNRTSILRRSSPGSTEHGSNLERGRYVGSVITQKLLDELWDFEDPAGSEQRFAVEEESESHADSERAELVTQRARALALQRRFEEGHALLDSLGDPSDPVVRTRVALERGRLLNSAGRPAEAVPEFETATRTAETAGLLFLQIDGLHMLAIADQTRSRDWAAQAIDLALAAPDDRTRRWLVSLHNNLGWWHFDAGRLSEALDDFQQAQQWAEQVGNEQQRVWAREAIDECVTAMAARDGP
jgi:tetratricopeptide (TPR) repeat protein